jgi:hypothetical protein
MFLVTRYYFSLFGSATNSNPRDTVIHVPTALTEISQPFPLYGGDCEGASSATAILVFDRPSLHDQTAAASISLNLSAALKSSLNEYTTSEPNAISPVLSPITSSTNQVHAGRPYATNITLDPKYRDLLATLVFADLRNNQVISREIPLSAFFGSSPISASSTTSATLTLHGFPYLYPSDQYEAQYLIYLSLPNSIAVSENQDIPSTLVPLTISARLNNTARDYSYHFVKDTSCSRYFPKLQFSVTRDAETQGFLYAMTLLPLLILISVASVAAHIHIPSNPSSHSDQLGLLLGLAAALFTVPPLHAVLVPSNFPILTVLDMMLAIQIVIYILVYNIRFLVTPWTAWWKRSPVSAAALALTPYLLGAFALIRFVAIPPSPMVTSIDGLTALMTSFCAPQCSTSMFSPLVESYDNKANPNGRVLDVGGRECVNLQLPYGAYIEATVLSDATNTAEPPKLAGPKTLSGVCKASIRFGVIKERE